ncbi:flagellar basal body rod protein FlgF [Caballeronia sp. dw_19]|uniref:flagellar basal body rod protein FlgF n=1 Tax=unclassified Caballeronia TaxID=2646786 RepID=UPI001BCFE6D3|nr:flagellar basal body rod protein FlgF [Caballeronia sp. dw_19]
MDAFIYTAMSGADRALRGLQVRANNLANTNTGGFRADVATSESMAVDGYGYDSRHLATLGSGGLDSTPGKLTETGRPLDVAIQGAGYFAVESGDGPAYTRAGSFTVTGDGALMLGARAVLGEGGPIMLPPNHGVTVGQDGTISIVPEGSNETQTVDRLMLVNPDPTDLIKNEAGLIVSRSGTSFEQDDSVLVLGAHLESSNVSAVEEMMQTMSLTRSFEIQMRLFKVADEMADAGNRLIRS